MDIAEEQLDKDSGELDEYNQKLQTKLEEAVDDFSEILQFNDEAATSLDDRLNQANGILESIGAYIDSVADKATEPGREREADSNYNQIRNILGEMKGTRKMLDERRDQLNSNSK